MIARIMKYEWRNLNADRAPLAVAAILTLAIAYGVYNGWQWVGFQKEAIAATQLEERERLERIRGEIPRIEAGEKQVTAFADPRLPQSFGRNMGLRYAAMPPDPLAALSIGQSDLHPYYFKVSTNSKETFVNNDEIENPVHLLAGRFDLSFVILFLYPLVILAFSYNIVSAEKEAGTLALTLSQPVTLATMVAGKVMLRALFIFLLAIVVAMVGVIAGGVPLTAAGVIPRLLLWAGITVCYGAFWFALAIAVNALGRSSATNAMTLAGLWLVLVVIVPSVLNVVVKSLYPVPSRIELIQAIRVAGEESTRQSSALLAKYLEDHPEMAPRTGAGEAADFGTLLVALNDATERKVRPVLAEYERQLARQQESVDRLRYLSPAIVTQAAFNDLAGAGPHRYRNFLEQVDRYHRQWREFFTPRILQKVKLKPADLDSLPAFSYVPEPEAEVVARARRALLGLAIVVTLAAIPGVLALRRYPVAG